MTYCPLPTAHCPPPLPPAPCPLPPAHRPLPTHGPPQVRTSFSEATRAYTSFAAAFQRNQLADSWPLLAELHWGLLMVRPLALALTLALTPSLSPSLT